MDSDIVLPWPSAPPFAGEPQVSIRLGEVARTLESPVEECDCWQTAPGSLLLNAKGIARCMVSEEGRLVRVAPAEDNPDGYVCMLDSVLAACLHMRGVLALRASAIATAEGAALFAGANAAGNSTLVAALIDRGYPLLADGMVGIGIAGGEAPIALGGFPQISLRTKAMKELDESWRNASGASVRSGIDIYAVAAPRFHLGETPVRTVCVLARTTDGDVAFKPLAPLQAAAELLRNTVRWRFLRGLGKQGQHLQAVASVVRRAAVGILRLPNIESPPSALAARVAERLPPPA